MQTHNIKKNTSNKVSRRIGRGGDRGKTSGRGHKGQNARAGTSGRMELRDMIKKIPKLRGHGVQGNRNKSIMKSMKPISLSDISDKYVDGEKVNQFTLVEKGLLNKEKGKIPQAKILANGEIDKKVIIENLLISKSAKDIIEKAGGEVK